MPREVVFRPEAEDELLEAWRWYESRSDNLGLRFVTAVDILVEHIMVSPYAFPRVHGET